MVKIIWVITGIIILLAVIGGVALYHSPSLTPNSESNSNLNPNLNPTNSPSITDLSVVQANNQFALDIYKHWAQKENNIFFSPYSISSALAMTYEGAKGGTANEMERVLHFPLDANARRNSFSQINSQINEVSKPYALSTANAIWVQRDYPLSQDYLNIVEQTYNGGATNLDFKADAVGSREIINGWVENKTDNKIIDLVPQGGITSFTRLVLTNAIYFKANWTIPFEEAATQDQDFKLGNTTIKVPVMNQEDNFNYAEFSDLQALELPYLGNDLSMVIILPKNSLTSVEASLDSAKLALIRNALKSEDVDVSLPRFKMETKYFMAADLIDMGMPTAFSADADFSGMTLAQEQLYISQVIHQAFVNVTESGTEAAAATAVLIVATSAGPGEIRHPKIFKADHSFIFLIQQKDTGNILFMGRVSNPAA